MILTLALFVSCSDSTTDPEDKNATKVSIAELSTQPGFETYQDYKASDHQNRCLYGW